MVLIAVRVSDMLRQGRVPMELSHLILASQWRVIVDGIERAHQDAIFLSCCCEFATCLVCAFPCIFLFHPCISDVVVKQGVAEKVVQLNNLIFDGYPVMIERDGNILFETDLIRIQEAVYVDRTNTGEYFGKTLSTSATTSPLQMPTATAQSIDSGEAYITMPSAVPVQVGRTLIVRVPANAGPGSVLSVTAPDGTQLSIVVPPNISANREITVAY